MSIGDRHIEVRRLGQYGFVGVVIALASALGMRLWLKRRASSEYAFRMRDEREPISGPGRAVDHDRQPGVPPPSNDDFDFDFDKIDVYGAGSFPASDPPSGW